MDNSNVTIDPRVKENLDIMNDSSVEINKYESELTTLKNSLEKHIRDSSTQIEVLGSSNKKSIKSARSYFELLKKSRMVRKEATDAAAEFHDSIYNLKVAQRCVNNAETLFQSMKAANADTTEIQHQLNICNEELAKAINLKRDSELVHLAISKRYTDIEKDHKEEYLKNRRKIEQSRSYYNLITISEDITANKKAEIKRISEYHSLAVAKYDKALEELNKISNDIHDYRRESIQSDTLHRYIRSQEMLPESGNIENSENTNDDEAISLTSCQDNIHIDSLFNRNPTNFKLKKSISSYNGSEMSNSGGNGNQSSSDLKRKSITKSNSVKMNSLESGIILNMSRTCEKHLGNEDYKSFINPFMTMENNRKSHF